MNKSIFFIMAILLILSGCSGITKNLQQSKGNCIDRALFCANICIREKIPVIIYVGDVKNSEKGHMQAAAFKDGEWRWQEAKGSYCVNVNKYSWFEPNKIMTIKQVRKKYR